MSVTNILFAHTHLESCCLRVEFLAREKPYLEKQHHQSLFGTPQPKTPTGGYLGGGNSNIFYVHPYLGKMHPIWRAYFSNGLKPPTSHSFNVWFVFIPEFTPKLSKCIDKDLGWSKCIVAEYISIPPRRLTLKNSGLEDDFPFPRVYYQVNHVNLPGCIIQKSTRVFKHRS